MPTRFGICTDQNRPFSELSARWRQFEELGFDSVWDCDHLNQPSSPDGPYFEGWTLLAALAATTRTIRIGVLVSSNTFRHPALLAQQACTVDHISGGRLELGVGAGWYRPEHDRFGIAFPPATDRVEMFREAVHVLDSLLTQPSTTFAGTYYQLRDAAVRPAPVQRPRPPLTLGAHRSRMLRICAEYAQAWNSYGSPEEIGARNRVLDRHCLELGRSPGDVRRSLYVWSSMLTEQGMADPWSSTAAFEETVERYRAVGINEFIIDQPGPHQQAVLEKVASDVIPHLRAG